MGSFLARCQKWKKKKEESASNFVYLDRNCLHRKTTYQWNRLTYKMLGLVRRGNGTGSTVSDTTHASSSGSASRRAKGLRAWKPADRALQLFDPRNKVRCNETDGVRVQLFQFFPPFSFYLCLTLFLSIQMNAYTDMSSLYFFTFLLTAFPFNCILSFS